MSLCLDLSKTSSKMFFKPYQAKILRVLSRSCEPLCAREIWDRVNMDVAEAVSRSKIIYFLEASVDNGIIDFSEDSGNGIRYFLNGFRTNHLLPK